MDINTNVDGIIRPTSGGSRKEKEIIQDKQVRKLVRISLIFFACAVLFSIIYMFVGGNNNKNAITIDTNGIATTTPTPVVRVESWSYATDPITLSVEYPQLVHTASSTLEDAINAKFKADAKKIYDDNLKELKDSAKAFRVESAPVTTTDASGTATTSAPVVTYSRDITFERTVLKDRTYLNPETGMLSVAYTQYSDTGGAHGTFSYAAELLDLNTNKDLTLKDILQGDYQKMLVKDIDTQIRTASPTCLRCGDLSGELDNLKTVVADSFILSNDGITFLYSAYDLGSYAATSNGEEVTVSKDKLKDYMLRQW